jgi:hypothetical protein
VPKLGTLVGVGSLFLFGSGPPCKLGTWVQVGLDPNKTSGVGTNLGLLVHVLPGPNKGFLYILWLLLSWIRKQYKPPGRLVCSMHSFTIRIYCDSRCPFGKIDNRKQMLGRFTSRSHFQTNCWFMDLKRASRPLDFWMLDLMGHRWPKLLLFENLSPKMIIRQNSIWKFGRSRFWSGLVLVDQISVFYLYCDIIRHSRDTHKTSAPKSSKQSNSG